MSKENNTTTNKKPMVHGTVAYYGSAKAYKSDKKEIKICIENPTFTNLTKETICKMYGFEDVKEFDADAKLYEDFKKSGKERGNNTISGAYHEIIKGNIPERIYFHTDEQYAPDMVYTIENGSRVLVDIADVEMNKAEISMILNKSYIGKILVTKNGEPFDPFA